jgi:S1-C subfamily serine protease
MGVGSIDASDPQVQFQLDPPVDQGAVVANVVPDGPADRAGVRVGDVIVAFGGTGIASAQDLGDAIRSHRPGDSVEFVVVRAGGERVTLTVDLGVNPVPTG